ncbi:hypothetical protein HY772_09405 [Candidatus Woesearchaeota archaeon]|nr:hypothetical protein [Candidatus Woesearchaeota archaeon]
MKKTAKKSAACRYHLLASFLLRIGLGLVFLYAAVSAFLQPNSWIGFLPSFIRTSPAAPFLLNVFGLYQTALAIWLLSGKRTFHAAVLASLTLTAIIFTNINALDVVFRDVAILFCAAALSVLSRENNNGK